MNEKLYEPHLSSIGNINANLLAMLLYIGVGVLGWFVLIIAAVVIFVMEKGSRLVKFSAVQMLLLCAIYSVLRGIVNAFAGLSSFSMFGVGILRGLFSFTNSFIWGMATLALGLLYLFFVIKGAIAAYHWKELQIPLIGTLAEKLMATFGGAAYTGDGTVPPQYNENAQPQNGPYNTTTGQPGQPPYNGSQPYGQQAPPQGGYQPGQGSYQQPYYAPGQQPTQPVNTQPGYGEGAVGGGAQKDPNSQLPPDMRDGKPPKDMF